jgi:hypothetical protein
VQSTVPSLSQRGTTFLCPSSLIHSLPCHLLSPTSYPTEYFLFSSLPAQVTNTCPGAHYFVHQPPCCDWQTHLLTHHMPLPFLILSGGGWDWRSHTRDVRQEGTGARGAITRGLALPLSIPPSEKRTKGVTKQ